MGTNNLLIGTAGLVLVLPILMGAPALPVQQTEWPFDVRLVAMAAFARGDAQLTAEEAALEVVGPVTAQMQARTITIVHYEYTKSLIEVDVQHDDLGAYWATSRADDVRISRRTFDNATLCFAGADGGRLLAWPNPEVRDPGFRVTFAKGTEMEIAGYPTGHDFIVDSWAAQEEIGLRYEMYAPLVAIGNGYGHLRPDVPMPTARFQDASIRGGSIAFDEGTLWIQHAGGAEQIETGTTPTGAEPSNPAVSQQRRSFVVVHLSEAQDVLVNLAKDGAKILLMANGPEWTVHGTLETRVRSANMTMPHANRTIDDESLLLEGNLSMETELEGRSDLFAIPGMDPLGGQWRHSNLPQPAMKARIAGDARTMLVSGEPAFSAAPTPVPVDPGRIAQLLGLLVLVLGGLRAATGIAIGMMARAPLNNARRQEIMWFIQKHGIGHVREVHHATGIPVGTVSYHLRVLEKAGLVRCITPKEDRARVCFPAAAGWDYSDLERLALLNTETRRQIVRMLVHKPGLDQETIARGVGVTRSTVSRQLARLVNGGLVDEVSARPRAYRASGLARDWFLRLPR